MSSPATPSKAGRVAAIRQRYGPLLKTLRSSETAKASWLAIAMMINNVIALASTVVFARLLGDRYGSLAALISYFLILAVAGYAMQVATAREGVLGHLGVGPALAATVRGWTRSILILTAVLAVVSVLLRHPIAQAVGVNDEWAAALGIPAGCLYLLLTVLRGVLQGTGDYRTVGLSLIGEQTARLVIGAVLAVAGLGVLGAYLGTPLSFVVMSVYCLFIIHRDIGEPTPGMPQALGLWRHVAAAWPAIAALTVIALLQNVDIIAARHRFDLALDSSYAATAVAAKVVIWVAMGAGFYVVPEVARRRAAGEDTRSVLVRAMVIIAVVSIPCLLIFAAAPHLLLELAFGKKRATAYDSLLILGVAFTILAATYLAIQYMLALKRYWFLIPLGAVAVAEPILLFHASREPEGFAAVVLAVQAAGALLAFAIALWRGSDPRGLSEPADASSAPEMELA
jgi:O-antigen/teichoic acid export membrane protein